MFNTYNAKTAAIKNLLLKNAKDLGIDFLDEKIASPHFVKRILNTIPYIKESSVDKLSLFPLRALFSDKGLSSKDFNFKLLEAVLKTKRDMRHKDRTDIPNRDSFNHDVIFTHEDCRDGLMAAYNYTRLYYDHPHITEMLKQENFDLFPANYGRNNLKDNFPDKKVRRIVYLDYSPSPEELLFALSCTPFAEIHIYDHHVSNYEKVIKSIDEKLEVLSKETFDNGLYENISFIVLDERKTKRFISFNVSSNPKVSGSLIAHSSTAFDFISVNVMESFLKGEFEKEDMKISLDDATSLYDELLQYRKYPNTEDVMKRQMKLTFAVNDADTYKWIFKDSREIVEWYGNEIYEDGKVDLNKGFSVIESFINAPTVPDFEHIKFLGRSIYQNKMDKIQEFSKPVFKISGKENELSPANGINVFVSEGRSVSDLSNILTTGEGKYCEKQETVIIVSKLTGNDFNCRVGSSTKTAKPLAHKLGGGGHDNAAGVAINKRLLTLEEIELIEKRLKEIKEDEEKCPCSDKH